MDYLLPDLEQYEATENEKRIAAEFTRVAPSGEVPQHSAWLKVGHQYFKTADAESFSRASWYCWMLAKALITVRKSVVITVNGVKKFVLPVNPPLLTYEELVEMAGMTGQPSMTFRCRAPFLQGVLSPGSTVEAIEGLNVNVAHTGSA